MTPTPIFKQLSHVQNIDQYGADKPKQRHGKAWHSKEDKEREICLACVLDECTGGGRNCPLVLRKKSKKRKAKRNETETEIHN